MTTSKNIDSLFAELTDLMAECQKTPGKLQAAIRHASSVTRLLTYHGGTSAPKSMLRDLPFECPLPEQDKAEFYRETDAATRERELAIVLDHLGLPAESESGGVK